MRDDRARREWLWFRAKTKDDAYSIASLQRADPTLQARMAPIEAACEAIDDQHERLKAYEAVWDERFPLWPDG